MIPRTQHLLDLIALHKPHVITEIGVAKGHTAVQMIVNAAQWHPIIEYHGFDLFTEGMTDEIARKERHAGNVLSFDDACRAFSGLADKFRERGRELHWFLHRGPTSQTLLDSKADSAKCADLVYLDGGHSVETIRSDLQELKEAKVICLDDFYYDRPGEFLVKWGCNTVAQDLYPSNYAFLPIMEKTTGSDGQPISVGQIVIPRSAWPWARLQAALTVIRAKKPKNAFVYADDLSTRYIKNEVEIYGGVIAEDHSADADFCYVDCARRCDEGTHIFMDTDEAKDCFDKTQHIPARVFAGLVQGEAYGAGSIMPEGALVVAGLDQIDGKEVAAFVFPKDVWPQQKSQIHVATRNCVDDSVIQENIKANTPRIKLWVEPCIPHDGCIAVVSAGPSLEREIDDILALRVAGYKIVTVKHAHDKLIDAGVIPWACILLDPRDHVSQFIQNPHPETIYFTGSMVAPTTLDLLLQKNARVVGYHALVGAGEDKLLPQGTRFLVGGTSAAMRGLPLLLMLGFRKFVLFAYDSCYESKPEKLGEKTKLGYERFVKVEVGGRKFWTELELVAQAQDFKQFLETLANSEMLSSVHLDVRGSGLIPHLWQLMRPLRPAFDDVARGW